MCFSDDSQRPYESYPPPRHQNISQREYYDQQDFNFIKEVAKAKKRSRRNRGVIASIAGAGSGAASAGISGGGGGGGGGGC